MKVTTDHCVAAASSPHAGVAVLSLCRSSVITTRCVAVLSCSELIVEGDVLSHNDSVSDKARACVITRATKATVF